MGKKYWYEDWLWSFIKNQLFILVFLLTTSKMFAGGDNCIGELLEDLDRGATKRTVSSAYLKLLILIPLITIPFGRSLRIISEHRLKWSGDNAHPSGTPLLTWNQLVFPSDRRTGVNWSQWADLTDHLSLSILVFKSILDSSAWRTFSNAFWQSMETKNKSWCWMSLSLSILKTKIAFLVPLSFVNPNWVCGISGNSWCLIICNIICKI